MIIMRIKGGLGNQMFQYAVGRNLSLKTGLPLVLDRRHYRPTHEHGYGLDVFALADTPVENAALPPHRSDRPFANALSRVLGRGPRLMREAALEFDPAIAAIDGPAWLEGYFQTERYFAGNADIIRSEFTPTAAPDATNAAWLARIQADPLAVSLHVRRGDYVANPKFAARHGTCSAAYYDSAVAHMTDVLGAPPVIYAFSDDPDWVRDNLDLPATINVVGHNDASKNYEDLRLMGACRHHIIANSSFSWWGAWLNPRADKVVVAPAKWHADTQNDNPDIWADGWIRIAD